MARMIDADALHAEISKWPESVIYKDWVQSAIAIAPTVPAYGQWIRVEDEKPDTGQYVLVNHKDGVMQCAQYLISGYDDRELWMLDHYYKEQSEITHWMPLPEPPKEVMKDGKDD